MLFDQLLESPVILTLTGGDQFKAIEAIIFRCTGNQGRHDLLIVQKARPVRGLGIK
ncbi:hypothetical protein D3C87_1679730 [compost metagenome]